jgi:hypothetical protein
MSMLSASSFLPIQRNLRGIWSPILRPLLGRHVGHILSFDHLEEFREKQRRRRAERHFTL